MSSDENIPPVSSLRSKFEKLAGTSPTPESPITPRRKPARVRSNSTENKPERPQQLQYLDPKRVVSGPPDSSLLITPSLRLSPSSPDLKSSSTTSHGSRTLSQPSSINGNGSFSSNTISSPSSSSKTASLSRKPPPPPPPFLRKSSSRDNSAEEPSMSSYSRPKSHEIFPEHYLSPKPTTVALSETKPSHAASLPPALPARPRHSDNGSSLSLSPRPVSAAPGIDISTVKTRLTRQVSRSPIDTVSSEQQNPSCTNRPPPIPPRQSDQSDRRRHSSESTVSSSSSIVGSSSSSSSSNDNSHSNTISNSHRLRPSNGLSDSNLLRVPPPLPQRRSGSDEMNDNKPPLPRRRSTSPPAVPVSTRPRLSDIPRPPPRASGSTTAGLLPPPPVRSSGVSAKIPLLKTLHSSSHRPSDDSSSASEDETMTPTRSSSKTNVIRSIYDELPDSTNCSRRLPLAPASVYRSPVSVPLASVAAVAGNRVVVASVHEMKLYDMTKGVLSGTVSLDLREMGLEWKKDNRITAMEFRAGSENGDESSSGRHLWCGTKDGHIFEFDVAEQVVTRIRYNIHSSVVTAILRYGRAIVTVDEGGKILVWRDYVDFGGATPRVIRTTEKQGFVRVFNGLLWTSNGTGSGTGSSSSSSTLRGPSVRVHDVLSSTAPSSKILTPSEALLGAVTSGTILPSHPDRVYLGHEGGYISIWVDGKESFDSGRIVPTCVHTLKVANSDILTLEGVVDKLWSGTRNGVINVYDVDSKPTTTTTTANTTRRHTAVVDVDHDHDSSEDALKKPWRLTNSWQAYDKCPVSRIFVDPYSIAKAQALHVVSTGRGGQLRFWDGLLGADWIEGEVQKRETEFSTFRPLNVLICSWNTDAQKPETLHGNPANATFLSDVLNSVERPDIISFGFQELIDLENRSLTAKTVLLGGQKKNADGSISDKVSRSYRLWHDALVHAVRLAMPVDDPYVVLHTDNLVGLFSCIFVRQRQKALLRDSAMNIIKRGLGGRYGNKGAIVARFVFDDSSICFVNCHLAAGQSHVRARNRDVAAILENASALPRSETPEALSYAGGGDGTMILDHEICFLHGDLNYRIDMRRDTIINSIQNNDLNHIYSQDQLYKQIKNNPSFRLRSFFEPPLTFAPTYKYDRRTDNYDSSEKKRSPAWCDRILWHSREPSRVRNLHYRRYEVDVSDHRPISAGYSVTVKKMDNDARSAVKIEVTKSWKDLELELLIEMQEFYTTQHIL